MNFIFNYLDASAYVEDVGKNELFKLQQIAHQMNAEKCPFCGGEGVIVINHNLKNIVGNGCAIECNSCHTRTLMFYEGGFVGGEKLSIFDCLAEAAKRWNQRVQNNKEAEQ